jgi:hypothetical protein
VHQRGVTTCQQLRRGGERGRCHGIIVIYP